MKTLLAALLLAAPAGHAVDFDRGDPVAQVKPALPENPCLENSVLDRTPLTLSLLPNQAGQAPVTIHFAVQACVVGRRTSDGDPIDPPIASRRYRGDVGNYGLLVNTPGRSAAAKIYVIQYEAPERETSLLAAEPGEFDVKSLAVRAQTRSDVALKDWSSCFAGDRSPSCDQTAVGTLTIAPGR